MQPFDQCSSPCASNLACRFVARGEQSFSQAQNVLICLQFPCRTWFTFRVHVSTWNRGWDEMGSGIDLSTKPVRGESGPGEAGRGTGTSQGWQCKLTPRSTSQHSAQGAYLQLTQGGRPLKAHQNPTESQLVFWNLLSSADSKSVL